MASSKFHRLVNRTDTVRCNGFVKICFLFFTCSFLHFSIIHFNTLTLSSNSNLHSRVMSQQPHFGVNEKYKLANHVQCEISRKIVRSQPCPKGLQLFLVTTKKKVAALKDTTLSPNYKKLNVSPISAREETAFYLGRTSVDGTFQWSKWKVILRKKEFVAFFVDSAPYTTVLFHFL